MLNFIFRSIVVSGAIYAAKELIGWLMTGDVVIYKITYDGTGVSVAEGKAPVRSRLLDVADALGTSGVQCAEISYVEREGLRRMLFSKEIPKSLHQQIRNILLA
jgi:hypothetical protein